MTTIPDRPLYDSIAFSPRSRWLYCTLNDTQYIYMPYSELSLFRKLHECSTCFDFASQLTDASVSGVTVCHDEGGIPSTDGG